MQVKQLGRDADQILGTILQVPHLAGKLLAAMAVRVSAGLAYRTPEPSITGTC
jgi:hypothetical protein